MENNLRRCSGPQSANAADVVSTVARSNLVVVSTNRMKRSSAWGCQATSAPRIILSGGLGRLLKFDALFDDLCERFPKWTDLGIRLAAQQPEPCLANDITAPRRKTSRRFPFSVSTFLTDRSGTSAVEFAIVAAPFFAILLGTLELGLLFTVNTGLNVATQTLATQIRTGQVQAPGLAATSSSGVQLDLADAKTQLCNQVQIVSLANCIQQLQIDVRPLTAFQQMSSASPISGSTFNSSNLCYYSGNAGDIVEMRVYYLYPFIDPLLTYAFSPVKNYINSNGTWSGNYYPIQTTQVFKSESYSGQANSGAGC